MTHCVSFPPSHFLFVENNIWTQTKQTIFNQILPSHLVGESPSSNHVYLNVDFLLILLRVADKMQICKRIEAILEIGGKDGRELRQFKNDEDIKLLTTSQKERTRAVFIEIEEPKIKFKVSFGIEPRAKNANTGRVPAAQDTSGKPVQRSISFLLLIDGEPQAFRCYGPLSLQEPFLGEQLPPYKEIDKLDAVPGQL